jgi:hypothetical protein
MLRTGTSRLLVVLILGFTRGAVAVPASVAAPPSTTDSSDEAPSLSWHPDAGKDAPSAAAPTDSVQYDKHHEQEVFAYVLDPTTASKGDVNLEYRLGLASGVAADRPLPARLAVPGVEHAATLNYGVTDRIAPLVTVMMLEPTDHNARPQGTASFGARWQLTNLDSRFRLTLATVFFREFEGGLGAYGRFAASYDVGRLRLAMNFHGEHVFQPGRDGLDVMVLAGASYHVLDPLRFGVEYVGQDLEETFNAGAEGGARHFVGLDVALDVVGDQVQLVLAGARGFDRESPPLMGTLAALMTF